MPQFRSNKDIFKDRTKNEIHNENWFDTPFLQLPPNPLWDYKRQLEVEDVDIWEVITEEGGGVGVYASWCPYAEFYMIVNKGSIDSTYYGKGSDKYASKRLDELSIPYPKK
jgi:hypothetical protein